MPWVKHGRDRRASRPGRLGGHPRRAAGRRQPAGDRHRRLLQLARRRNRAHIGCVDAVARSPAGVRRSVSPAPVLSPGELGAFDDAGVTSSCLVEAARPALPVLHRLGARRERAVLSERRSGRQRRRRTDVPRVSRRRRCSIATPIDPYLTASPWVLVEGRNLADVVRLGHRMAVRPRPARGIAITSSTPSRLTGSTGSAAAWSASTIAATTSTPSAAPASCGTAIATGCGTRTAARPTAWAMPSRPTAWTGPDGRPRVRRRPSAVGLGLGDGHLPAGGAPSRQPG